MLASLVSASDRNALQQVLKRHEDATCAVEAIAGMLAREFGQATPGTPGHTPARLPAIVQVQLAPSTSQVVDVETILGKQGTRGHVTNLGDERVELRFVGPAGEQWSAPYLLPPNATIDLSWIVRRIEVRTGTDAAHVQILAQ